MFWYWFKYNGEDPCTTYLQMPKDDIDGHCHDLCYSFWWHDVLVFFGLNKNVNGSFWWKLCVDTIVQQDNGHELLVTTKRVVHHFRIILAARFERSAGARWCKWQDGDWLTLIVRTTNVVWRKCRDVKEPDDDPLKRNDGFHSSSSLFKPCHNCGQVAQVLGYLCGLGKSVLVFWQERSISRHSF